MIPQFEGLLDSQKELMYDAIPLITIYIAGADGKIDLEETEWAEKVTKIRSYAYHESLQEFYANISETYSDKLHQYITSLPNDVEERTVAINEKLAGLNSILTGLDANFAARYYKSLVSFAEHVAKASGGFLGFGSVSRAESKLLGLDMITPLELEEGEEEEEEDNENENENNEEA